MMTSPLTIAKSQQLRKPPSSTMPVTSPASIGSHRRRFPVLGVEVEALGISELNALIDNAIASGDKIVVANHNLHSIYLYHSDPKMRAFYARAHHIHIDGTPIIHLGRLLGLPLRPEHRVTYVDWLGPLSQMAAQNQWRVFFLGSRPGIAEKGAEVLRTHYPGLQIATAHGYFDMAAQSAESKNVISIINAYQPHVLILGMGMPRQEHWALEHMDQISTNVILNGGAAIDYIAGAIPTPPRWASRLCLEWAFRLRAEPRRLWRRYLVEPWAIIGCLVAQKFDLRNRI